MQNPGTIVDSVNNEPTMTRFQVISDAVNQRRGEWEDAVLNCGFLACGCDDENPVAQLVSLPPPPPFMSTLLALPETVVHC